MLIVESPECIATCENLFIVAPIVAPDPEAGTQTTVGVVRILVGNAQEFTTAAGTLEIRAYSPDAL